jgi:hypothetical protein
MSAREMAAAAGLVLLACAGAQAQLAQFGIIDTFGPGNSYDPQTALPIHGAQSPVGAGAAAAMRIEVQWGEGRLRAIEVALTPSAAGHDSFRASLHDGHAAAVGPEIWSRIVSIAGQQQPVTIVMPVYNLGPFVSPWSSEFYWLSILPADDQSAGQWHVNDQGAVGMRALRQWDPVAAQWGPWSASNGPLPAARVTLVGCYPNCDSGGPPPLLNVEDFTCFLHVFFESLNLPQHAQIASYANCDGSTTPPVLNVEDFACFVNAFAAACP